MTDETVVPFKEPPERRAKRGAVDGEWHTDEGQAYITPEWIDRALTILDAVPDDHWISVCDCHS